MPRSARTKPSSSNSTTRLSRLSCLRSSFLLSLTTSITCIDKSPPTTSPGRHVKKQISRRHQAQSGNTVDSNKTPTSSEAVFRRAQGRSTTHSQRRSLNKKKNARSLGSAVLKIDSRPHEAETTGSTLQGTSRITKTTRAQEPKPRTGMGFPSRFSKNPSHRRTINDVNGQLVLPRLLTKRTQMRAAIRSRG